MLSLEYQREWEKNNKDKRRGYNDSYRERMAAFVQTLKGPCERCGNPDLRVIQFHHRDPSKKELEVSMMLKNGYGKERIRNEAEKCQRLCANCHIITHIEWRAPL